MHSTDNETATAAPVHKAHGNRVVLNRQLAQMLKGGVIMDVTTPEQARIAEDAGACAVMALERIPADIRAAGGVLAYERPEHDQGHPRGREHPRHGEVPHRALRGSPGARGHRDRLHRRERSALPRRRRLPHRQDRASPCRSFAARATWAKPCAASPKAPR